MIGRCIIFLQDIGREVNLVTGWWAVLGAVLATIFFYTVGLSLVTVINDPNLLEELVVTGLILMGVLMNVFIGVILVHTIDKESEEDA